MKLTKNMIMNISFLIVFLILIIGMCINLFPLLEQVIKNSSNETKMIQYIQSYGFNGVLDIIGLQAIQVILAFFPAAAIQILSGLCYGIWYGTLISLIGYVIGNMVVFFALRQFKKVLTPFFEKKEKSSKKKSFLNIEKIRTMKHPEYIAFILYLVPGIPNNVLPYLFSQTKITFKNYFLIVVTASIPSILMSAWLGERIAKGDYFMAIIVGLMILGIAGFVLLFKNKIMAFVEKTAS